MASTYTDLGIEKMATGENAGTWGTKTNTNLEIIEKSIAGYVEQAVTSGGTTALSITDGDATESTSVARHAVIKLTGTITGNSIVTVPDSIEKVYIVTNGTSGAYTVQFKTASGTGITFGVSEKTTRLVYSDGTNLVDAGFGGATDMEGRELVLDADGDTTITADTDDQIDIKIAGADDFQFTANTFTAQSGSTIAAQALTATTVTASGIVKTDDTTEATSTTDGSLQTDGGLSVAKDAVLGDDLKLLSDSAVLSFGADSDTTLTHTDGTGLTLNSTNKFLFRDTGLYINSSTDGQLDLVADTEIQIAATTIDINGAVAMDGAITGATNITLSGELDAATGDFSGDVDVDGTLEADAITINGTAIGSIYGAVAGSSSIVTTGALDSGSITSGFGNIDTGSSTITTTGLITGGSLDIDDVLINGTTIGHTDDTDLITLANGVATVAGEISVTT
jgi:cytoskeletal protein CcmA (bactofilin family)